MQVDLHKPKATSSPLTAPHVAGAVAASELVVLRITTGDGASCWPGAPAAKPPWKPGLCMLIC